MPSAGKELFKTREEAIAFLRERAPLPEDDTIDGARAAATFAAKRSMNAYVIPRVDGPVGSRTLDIDGLTDAIAEEWTPRCGKELSYPQIQEIVQRLAAKAEAHFDRVRLEERLRTAAKPPPLTPKAKETANKAEQVKALMDGLSIGRRQVYELLRDGTTRPETAERMAKILRTKASDHFRRKKKTGKRPDLVAWFCAQSVDGCAFRDFINAQSHTDRLALALAREYGKDIRLPDHFDSCDDLANYAGLIGYDETQARGLWIAFMLWRVDAISEATKAELRTNDDPDDFG